MYHPTMPRRIALFELLNAALMCLWIGAAAMAGAAAAITFPTMHRLNPRLPDMERYGGEHWLFAGGRIMAPIFGIAGWIQTIGVAGSVVMFAIARWPRPGAKAGRLTGARSIVIIAILFVTAHQAAVLRPRMMRNLNQHWDAARLGDNTAAETARNAFDADHGPSNGVFAASLLLGLLCVGLTAAAVTTNSRDP